MECFYCLQEVKDGAIVCPHCGRDLAAFKLVKPTEERVSQLEGRVTALETLMSDTSSSLGAQRGEEQPSGNEADVERDRTMPTARVVVVMALVISASYWTLEVVFSFVSAGRAVPAVASFVLLPLFAGGIGGFSWPWQSFRAYGLCALLVSLLAVTDSVFTLLRVGPAGPAVLIVDFVGAFSVGALFFSGLRFGDLAARRRRWRKAGGPTEKEVDHLSRQRAAKLVERSGATAPSPTTTLVIQALGPAIVGLIGTLAATILTVYFD